VSNAALIAANRFGLGARPQDVANIAADPRAWLSRQLAGPAPLLQSKALRSASAILSEQGLERAQRRARDREIYRTETAARMQTALTTERAFLERLVYFWNNHFAVSVDKTAVLGIAGSFEREAIRPHILGNFTDLLLAAVRHPAMLLYLDNQLSVGPNSIRATRRRASSKPRRQLGINENLAREILELHTLGVNGGYTQADVTTFAKVITGWSVAEGEFAFLQETHEPGAKTILNKRYAQEGEAQGMAVLRDLATNPRTAQFIATKLARHFIAEQPSAAVVERLAKIFRDTGGQLSAVYRGLLELPEVWEASWVKFKTPSDYVISVFRALGQVDEPQRAVSAVEMLGQRVYSPGSPAGWSDYDAYWNGAAALLRRIEWVDPLAQRLGNRIHPKELAQQLFGTALTDLTRTAIHAAASAAQGLTLLLTAPEFMRR
jgi:uncharacterized protein (DUF1800 family)